MHHNYFGSTESQYSHLLYIATYIDTYERIWLSKTSLTWSFIRSVFLRYLLIWNWLLCMPQLALRYIVYCALHVDTSILHLHKYNAPRIKCCTVPHSISSQTLYILACGCSIAAQLSCTILTWAWIYRYFGKQFIGNSRTISANRKHVDPSLM